jgi:8-oxo-dGTP pyrophosphatase MutT (NUDIX family)
MRHLNIAMGLLKQGDRYLLQLRNGSNQTGKLQFIGCFGGQIEPGEAALQAACREVAEESTFVPNPSAAHLLGEVNVHSERHNQPITVTATIYQFDIPHDQIVEAKEGELVTMTKAEVYQNLHRLTPGTKACFKELL